MHSELKPHWMSQRSTMHSELKPHWMYQRSTRDRHCGWDGSKLSQVTAVRSGLASPGSCKYTLTCACRFFEGPLFRTGDRILSPIQTLTLTLTSVGTHASKYQRIALQGFSPHSLLVHGIDEMSLYFRWPRLLIIFEKLYVWRKDNGMITLPDT